MNLCWWIALVVFSFSLNLFAQETESQSTATAEEAVQEEAPAAAPKSSGRVEKIEVTGSHIKRIDVEGPSPVLTLDKDYLDRTGYNNVGDVLRDTTVASFGGGREASLSGGASTGASTTSLRGFGSDRILVLMDGKRLPTLGGSSTVDLALIPMAAVERIEILKDGASAIYGSDALGGVINIITKKNYDGATVELGYMTPESPGGSRTDVKASYGKTFAKGDVLGVFQYRSNEATQSRDYAFARPTPNWFSPSGSPGTWVDSGGPNAGSAADPCPAGQNNGGVCTFDYSPYAQITPSIDQFSTLLAGNYNINEELKVFARGIYTNRNVKSQLAPAPDAFRDDTSTGGINTAISQGTATGWGLAPASDLSLVRYRLVEEAGPRISEVISNSYALQSGVNGYFYNSWEWEFSGTYGASATDNEGVSGYANKEILFNLANQSPTEFNPFAAPGSKSDISSAKYKPLDTILSSMSTVNLKASGEIADLPAGPLALAVGVSNAWQDYEQTSDAVSAAGKQWGGSVTSVGSGRRDFQSAYTEFSLPPFTGMELQLAGRFDNYSDFGSTVNPKVGFRYQPVQALLFRGSWGTGFRAPSLEDLYQAQTVAYPFGVDPQTGFEGQFETLTGGNRNLREEKTASINLGFVYQIMRDLSFVFDYWEATQDNVVSSGGTRDIFAAEQQFGVGYLQGLGLDIIRNATTGEVERMIAPNVNLASKAVKGLDFKLAYTVKLFGDFNLNAGVDYSLLLELLEEPFPGLGIENRVGFSGIPYWRNNVSLGVGNRTYDVSVMVRTIGEQNASALSADPGSAGKTRDHTEFDLRMQYVAPWNGSFALLVKNVLNTDRPLAVEYLSSGFLNTDIYDPFGRAIGLTYTQEF